MKFSITATYDSKAQAFGIPMFTRTPGIAERWFMQECGNPASEIYKAAEDVSLFAIGSYNDETARIELLEVPKQLHHALTIKSHILAEAGKE